MSEKMPIDQDAKKEINAEGFEDNAAVIIGKKEEMPQKLETLEKEGYAENLATYIRMHKEIAVPAGELNEEMAESIGKYINAGDGFLMLDNNEKFVLHYLDKENNIARVSIDLFKIAELKKKKKEKDPEDRYHISVSSRLVEDELKKIGFSFLENMLVKNKLRGSISEYKEKLGKQEKERKSTEFDF